jgi:hypothetical protein
MVTEIWEYTKKGILFRIAKGFWIAKDQVTQIVGFSPSPAIDVKGVMCRTPFANRKA